MALAFMRHRASLKNQDLDRCNNQKDLLICVVNKINSFTRLEKIKYGIRLYSLIKTNIKYDEIFKLVKIDIGRYEKNTYTLKGKSIYDRGYYYVLDKEYIKKIKELL
jgi:anionic cell wall polymer biosynthesis LytR-Cps2A-Psr (LCP) family protein